MYTYIHIKSDNMVNYEIKISQVAQGPQTLDKVTWKKMGEVVQ